MQPFFRASLAAVLLAALPVWAQQGTIRGTVTDGEDATPLPNANLNLSRHGAGHDDRRRWHLFPSGPARLLYATSGLLSATKPQSKASKSPSGRRQLLTFP